MISHLSSSIPLFYNQKLLEINEDVENLRNSLLNLESNFKNTQLNNLMRDIGQCYWTVFKDLFLIKKRNEQFPSTGRENRKDENFQSENTMAPTSE